MNIRTRSTLALLTLALAVNGRAADIAGSKDPAGVERYTGSEIIGYHAPKFDQRAQAEEDPLAVAGGCP